MEVEMEVEGAGAGVGVLRLRVARWGGIEIVILRGGRGGKGREKGPFFLSPTLPFFSFLSAFRFYLSNLDSVSVPLVFFNSVGFS